MGGLMLKIFFSFRQLQTFAKRRAKCGLCTLSLGSLFVFCLLISPTSAGDSTISRVEGQWIVQKVIDFAPIVGLDDKQVNALTGQILTLRQDVVSFQNRICKEPTYSLSRQAPGKFFASYRIAVPKGLPKLVDHIEVQCAGANTIGPFLVNDKEILFVWYGALLSATSNPKNSSK
jgi:hypothetical protein